MAAVHAFWLKYTADMAHQHVLLAYAFVWLVQFIYLALVLRRGRRPTR